VIGLDTNVVLRLLTRDDSKQFNAAKKYLERRAVGEPALINRLVIAEVVWTLESGYHYTRAQIADALEGLLKTAEITLENSSAVRSALKAYRSGAGFSDALICATNSDAGCESTLTFDRDAVKKLPGFRTLV